MTRLIDAEALKKDIAENSITLEEKWAIEVECVKALIDLAPTIEERPKGEWTTRRKGLQVFFDCSNCGESICSFPAPYCPYCGAKMRGDNND